MLAISLDRLLWNFKQLALGMKLRPISTGHSLMRAAEGWPTATRNGCLEFVRKVVVTCGTPDHGGILTHSAQRYLRVEPCHLPTVIGWDVILSTLWLVDRIMISSSQDCDWLMESWPHAIQTVTGYGIMMSCYPDCDWLSNGLSKGHLEPPRILPCSKCSKVLVGGAMSSPICDWLRCHSFYTVIGW
jgi:hypothetical protein